MSSPGDATRRDVQRAAASGLLKAAELIGHRAQDNVPKGDPSVDPDPNVSLKDSMHIEVERGGRSVVISFNAPYAAKQHEDQHLKHPRGGGPKYLEKELLAEVPKLEGILASEVRKRMTGKR